jgi:hypothetical protein
MKREVITIDGCGRVTVPSDATNIWMNEMELVELFGVIVPTLRAAIRAVYKSGVLKPYEVERRIKLTNGYYSETYSLPMVVALAFRINTPNAARVRNALLERLCLRKERQVLWVSLSNRQACKC